MTSKQKHFGTAFCWNEKQFQKYCVTSIHCKPSDLFCIIIHRLCVCVLFVNVFNGVCASLCPVLIFARGPTAVSCRQLDGSVADIGQCLKLSSTMPSITQLCQLPCQDDCQLTQWSKFSPCDFDCVGVRTRRRALVGKKTLLFLFLLERWGETYYVKVDVVSTHTKIILL